MSIWRKCQICENCVMGSRLESAPAPAQVNRTSCAREEIKIIYVSICCLSFVEIRQKGNEHEAHEDRLFGQFMSCMARQIAPAPVCATGGKPSTWLPPGGLVEQAATRTSAFINTSTQKNNMNLKSCHFRVDVLRGEWSNWCKTFMKLQ